MTDGKTLQTEPHGSHLEVVARPYGLSDYRATRDIIIPALPRDEAIAWVKARAPRLRGFPLFAVLYFLNRCWELRAGWHIGVRRTTPGHSTVAWGAVDAIGRFKPEASDVGSFSSTAAQKVLELIVERINQISL